MKPVAALLLTARATTGRYTLSESYFDGDFLSRWIFWTNADPSHGAVHYVDRETAQNSGLVEVRADGVILRTDTHTVTGGDGRPSVRIQSHKMYNSGLFVVKLRHVPTGCGTWPAFWMFGEDAAHTWPKWGEYDIIEGVHKADHVMTTLHTTRNCDQSDILPGRDFTRYWEPAVNGIKAANQCFIDAEGQWHNQGCSQKGPINSMGQNFNDAAGGTFAAEWNPAAGYIRTFFWSTGSEPDDLARREPDPNSWGIPYSYFSITEVNCPWTHFKNMRMVFDLTFCGDLGGPTFAKQCPDIAKTMTCAEFVAQHPESMAEAYWDIAGLDVYGDGDVSEDDSVPSWASSQSSNTEPTGASPVQATLRSSDSKSGGKGPLTTLITAVVVFLIISAIVYTFVSWRFLGGSIPFLPPWGGYERGDRELMRSDRDSFRSFHETGIRSDDEFPGLPHLGDRQWQSREDSNTSSANSEAAFLARRQKSLFGCGCMRATCQRSS